MIFIPSLVLPCCEDDEELVEEQVHMQNLWEECFKRLLCWLFVNSECGFSAQKNWGH
jgi:hypothetical protein